jgi:hypothetical protein
MTCNVVFGFLLIDEPNILSIVLMLDDTDEGTASAQARIMIGLRW